MNGIQPSSLPLQRRFRPKLVQIMTVYPKTKPTCMIKELIVNRMLNVIRIEMFIWLRWMENR
ncbi:hypothetical protein DPMN_057030 [Dreissena polymorpha]|uniref:Uncharacterized protein n=1 Tax=Dreissena polymorpha TaxID=45954 RepID=A0A9D4CST0_DREPO|nr:hypothetical protein DPMN_057030 [Dreissena polymorpha]